MDRQVIIDEIKRTAAQNDGKPLGMQRFENETSIKKSEWYGIHWATWGEALSEAGFKPNEFNKGYDQTWLIESFIGILKEVGNWPTEGNLRILCRNREDLPDAKTYRVRLGRRTEMAARILAYCQGRKGHEGIVAICEPFTVATATITVEESQQEKHGFVYLMKFGKYHKIGRSNSVGRRAYEIGTKLPEELVTVHTIKTDDPAGVERYWHDRFDGMRKEGEWFELRTADIRAFKKWKRIF